MLDKDNQVSETEPTLNKINQVSEVSWDEGEQQHPSCREACLASGVAELLISCWANLLASICVCWASWLCRALLALFCSLHRANPASRWLAISWLCAHALLCPVLRRTILASCCSVVSWLCACALQPGSILLSLSNKPSFLLFSCFLTLWLCPPGSASGKPRFPLSSCFCGSGLTLLQ